MKLDNERIVNVPDINFVYRKKLRKLFTSNFHIVCVCRLIAPLMKTVSLCVFTISWAVKWCRLLLCMYAWCDDQAKFKVIPTNNISKQTSRISELFVEFRYASLHTRLIHEGDRFLVLCYRSSSYYLDV